MKLRPIKDYPESSYPRASRLVKSVFLAASMTATSLGGCGPATSSGQLDAVGQHDLADTVSAPEDTAADTASDGDKDSAGDAQDK